MAILLNICSFSVFSHPLPSSYWCLSHLTEASPFIQLPAILAWHMQTPLFSSPQCCGPLALLPFVLLASTLAVLLLSPLPPHPHQRLQFIFFYLFPQGGFILSKLPYIASSSVSGDLSISLAPLLL